MLNLTRQFAIIGAIVVVLATTLLSLSYRHLSTISMVTEIEHQNTILARAIARQIWTTLPDYGLNYESLSADEIRNHPSTNILRGLLDTIIVDSPVLKLRIYDLQGRVIHSTDYAEIGNTVDMNERFQLTLDEFHASSQMVFREDAAPNTDNEALHDIVITYLPVMDRYGIMRAIFELHADVTQSAEGVRAQSWKLTGGFLTFALSIYFALFLGVRRSNRIIHKQYQDVQQREQEISRQKDALERALKTLETNVEALRQSEDRLAAAFYISPDLVAVTDMETGRHIDVNEAWLKTLGWARAEVIGKTAQELGVWETQEERQRLIDTFRKQKYIRNHETRLIARDGTPRDVLISGEEVLLDGKPRMMLFANDITDSKHARQLLEDTQKMAKIYYWRWRFGDNTLYDTSANYGELYETSLDAVPTTYDAMAEAMHPDDRPRVLAAFEAADRERRGFDIEFRIIAANGAVKHVREFGEIEYDATGEPVGHAGYIQDITALKEAEARIRSSERILAKAQNLAKIYYWRWSFETNRVSDISPEFGRLYNIDTGSNQDAPRTYGEKKKFTHPDDYARMLHAYEVADLNKSDFEVEYRIITADGHVKYVYEIGEIERDEAGTPIGHVGFMQDVTALKEAEGASRAKSEFLAHMSHELRTPLNAILGFSESMQSEIMGPIGNEAYREYVRNIHSSGKHLLDLINDILDISAIEAGQGKLDIEKLPLNDVIASCLALTRHRAHARHITIEEKVPTNPIYIAGDERRLKQVLLNIIGNAIKFTPEHGCITITASNDTDNTATINIHDTGPGMTPEDAKIAMMAFGRASSARTQKEEGTGLGLPLSKALIELHGGSLDLTTAPGKGVSVTITLPAATVADTA